MSNGCIVLDKKVCPDPLEAFKFCGDPKDDSKQGFWGCWGAGGGVGITLASPMPYVGSSFIWH